MAATPKCKPTLTCLQPATLLFWFKFQKPSILNYYYYYYYYYYFLTKYHSGDEVKKTEMGRTCGTYGGEQRCIQGFSGET
jgi:hypothetical protein